MRAFFFLFLFSFLLVFDAQAWAQAAAPAPARAAAAPTITQSSNRCVRPGESVTLKGRGLDTLDKQKPALHHGQEIFFLDVLNRTETTMNARLPLNTALAGGKKYPLILADKDNRFKFLDTGLFMELCAASLPPVKTEKSGKTTEILLSIDTDKKPALLATLEAEAHDIIRQSELTALNTFLVLLRVPEENIDDTLAALRAKLPRAQIDINREYHPAGTPRVYAPEKIAWPKASAECLAKTSGIAIGIIDGGVDRNHENFLDSAIVTKSFLKEKTPDLYHGTAVASVLVGKTGLLPKTRLFSATVLRKGDGGKSTATSEAIARALDWLLRENVRLINVSLAAQRQDQVLTPLFTRALDAGTIIFAAAGNAGAKALPSYPAAIEGIIGVTATDAADRAYVNANQGGYIDFAAPGVDVWLADPEQGGVYKSGTSYAAPYALAAAALVLGHNRAVPRDVVVKSLKENAKDLGDRGHDPIFGHGLIQVRCE